MKKGTKLLSVLLAFVMVISMFAATFAASAADYYKPHYTEDVTEEDVSLMLGDVNTLLSRELLTGDIIEEIYKFLPSLSAIVNNGSQSNSTRNAAYYKAAQPERFADLPDGEIVDDVTDENGNIVTPGTFTTFFETHPIVCSDLAVFQDEINKIVDLVVIQNVLSTIVFAFLIFDQTGAGDRFATGLDEVCEALDVEQAADAATVLGLTTGSGDVDGTRAYVKNIVAALLPDLSNNVMAIVRNVADEEKGAKLYSGVTQILGSLEGVLNAVSAGLGGMIDLSGVLPVIQDLNTTWTSLPTLGEGDTTRLDIEGVIGQLVPALTQQLVGIELKIAFVDREENGLVPPTTPVIPDLGSVLTNGIQFRHMQLDRIANCESTADVMKTIYDYLYDNLIADPTNNALIGTVLDLAGAVGFEIPQAIADFIDAALDMDNSELANELILMLANEAGRHVLTAYTEKAPTCTQDGNTAYYVCEACGRWFTDETATEEILDPTSVAIPATGHTPAEALVTDPEGHYVVCEVCGATLEAAAHVDEDGDGLCDVCAFEIPAEPEEPTEPEQPTNPEEPTQPEQPTEPSTDADDETPVKDADIPKTGTAASIGFGALSLAAAGALVLLRVRSKKNDII